MSESISKDQKKDFLEHFKDLSKDFYNLTLLEGQETGVSFLRKTNKYELDKVSMFHIFYLEKYINNNKKIPIRIEVIYGKDKGNGVSYRSEKLMFEPLDFEDHTSYFYDPANKCFYKKNRIIPPSRLVQDVYIRHIRPSLPFRGVWTRTRIFFYWNALVFLFNALGKVCYFLLYIVSGDKYKYTYYLGEEELNNKIIKSSFRSIDRVSPAESNVESKKINFFSLQVSQWSIVLYAIMHLSAYWLFIYINYYSKSIWRIFENNFLTVLYVCLSFWLLEFVIPGFLKFLIRSFSTLSAKSQSVKIK